MRRKTEALLDVSEEPARDEREERLRPDTEVEYWRGRRAKFNSITEQLKGKERQPVLGVSMAGRSQAHKREGQTQRVTDASNESATTSSI